MGTRGAWGFVLDGQEYLTYNHFGSYPAGLGSDILTWARKADWAVVREQVAALRLVNVDDTPTEAERVKHSGSHQNVSTGQDWYSLLRGNQGNPAATLASGVMTDDRSFPLDSLFCEWAYVIDLDADTFEIYRGFQTALPTEGRWAGSPAEDIGKYKAVQRVAAWPLDALPAYLSGIEEV